MQPNVDPFEDFINYKKLMKENLKNDKWINENIDVGMRYAIKNLNKKGYETTNCCEGHYIDDFGCYYGAYISFKEYLPHNLFPKLPSFPWRLDDKNRSKYKTPFMELGGGYKHNRNEEFEHTFYWTGTRYKRVSREEKDKEHELFIQELNNWVDSLPNKKAEKIYLNYESPVYKPDSNSIIPFKIIIVETICENIHTVTTKKIEINDNGNFPIHKEIILNSTVWKESEPSYALPEDWELCR